jgi:hypothetical protein
MKYGKYWFHLQFFFIANFHVLGLFIHKIEFRAKKKIPSVAGLVGVAGGFWTKFEAQLAQP